MNAYKELLLRAANMIDGIYWDIDSQAAAQTMVVRLREIASSPAGQTVLDELRTRIGRLETERNSLRVTYEQNTAAINAERRIISDLLAERERLRAGGEMLAAVTQGAKEEFVRVPYGASFEDVAAIHEWHKMAANAMAEWGALKGNDDV